MNSELRGFPGRPRRRGRLSAVAGAPLSFSGISSDKVTEGQLKMLLLVL